MSWENIFQNLLRAGEPRYLLRLALTAGAKMLYYDRIDVSEVIDANETSVSKEYDIYYYWYFLSFNHMY